MELVDLVLNILDHLMIIDHAYLLDVDLDKYWTLMVHAILVLVIPIQVELEENA